MQYGKGWGVDGDRGREHGFHVVPRSRQPTGAEGVGRAEGGRVEVEGE